MPDTTFSGVQQFTTPSSGFEPLHPDRSAAPNYPAALTRIRNRGQSMNTAWRAACGQDGTPDTLPAFRAGK